jgi:hypothetical protein
LESNFHNTSLKNLIKMYIWKTRLMHRNMAQRFIGRLSEGYTALYDANKAVSLAAWRGIDAVSD